MSHTSPLTTLWWILENLFCDRLILCVYAYKLDLIHEYILIFVQIVKANFTPDALFLTSILSAF